VAQRRIQRRIQRPLTPEQKAEYKKVIQQIEAEKPRLREIGLKAKAEFDARQTKLREAVAALKSAREQLGLSLADIRQRTGIDKANLSRLENAADPNPSFDTLTRYAEAVGKEIVITLADKGRRQRR
jgi:hypothetical protein